MMKEKKQKMNNLYEKRRGGKMNKRGGIHWGWVAFALLLIFVVVTAQTKKDQERYINNLVEEEMQKHVPEIYITERITLLSAEVRLDCYPPEYLQDEWGYSGNYTRVTLKPDTYEVQKHIFQTEEGHHIRYFEEVDHFYPKWEEEGKLVYDICEYKFSDADFNVTAFPMGNTTNTTYTYKVDCPEMENEYREKQDIGDFQFQAMNWINRCLANEQPKRW